jgi:hypothetical protein
MTLDEAIEAFNAEFPGWWFKVGYCHRSCDADMGLDKYDVGPDGGHPDSDLIEFRTFDDGFSVDLPQPSTIAEALLHVMNEARCARRAFRARTEVAAAMEEATKARRAAYGKRWSSWG